MPTLRTEPLQVIDQAAAHYREQALLWTERAEPEVAARFAALSASLAKASRDVDAKARVAS